MQESVFYLYPIEIKNKIIPTFQKDKTYKTNKHFIFKVNIVQR